MPAAAATNQFTLGGAEQPRLNPSPGVSVFRVDQLDRP
jgi:hypothetical protein